jgi:hypothetical protein
MPVICFTKIHLTFISHKATDQIPVMVIRQAQVFFINTYNRFFMGKMKNGILDSFSDTIGRVVGTSWRGVAVMRSKAHARKNANTPKQQEQKAKFKVAADLTKSMHDLLIPGFRDQAVQMTGSNYGLSLISFSFNSPTFQSDPKWVKVMTDMTTD